MPDEQTELETQNEEPTPSEPPSTEPLSSPEPVNTATDYDAIINSVRQFMHQQQPTATYVPPTPRQVSMPAKPLDPDKILTNPDEWQQDLVGNMAGAMQSMQAQVAGPLYENLASSAKHLSRSDPKVGKIWEKYGEEIDALASSQAINPAIKGSKDFWDQAARVVMSNHLDEVVQERAQEVAASLGRGVETGDGSYGAADTHSEGMDKLRETKWGARLIERYGEKGARRNLEKMGVSVDKYAEMAGRSDPIVNPNNPAEWWNRDLARDVDNG